MAPRVPSDSCLLRHHPSSGLRHTLGERKRGKKQRGRPGEHCGTSQLKQHPYSRGKRKNMMLTHLPARQSQRTIFSRKWERAACCRSPSPFFVHSISFSAEHPSFRNASSIACARKKKLLWEFHRYSRTFCQMPKIVFLVTRVRFELN